MKPSRPSMDAILEAQVQMLATTRRPKTVKCYRYCVHNFLAYLHTAFPRLHQLSQLRRDPHLLAWFRFLCQQYPSPGNRTRHLHLLTVRRLLRDLANQGHPVTPDLIGREDFPPSDHYLPKPLSLEQDQRLQQQLRLADTLEVNALRLMRATGIRISECIDLPLDCLQQISEQQVALRVPLGKLHSERFVPVDEETQRVVARIVELGGLPLPVGRGRRAVAPGPDAKAFLLPRYWQPGTWYRVLHNTLRDMARAAGCTGRVHPHRLRHSFATEMVRLGVSLPALMRMMGHRDIRMTLRYVEVVQLDLQREFHRARQNTASLYTIPQLPLPSSSAPTRVDLPTIRQSVAATRHLLHLLQPQLENQARRKLHRLAQRLLNIDHELDHLTPK
ncbi:MAG: site-specific integrase [Acidobacteriia bacterium]|nr:site-specific integrase [Terriglobia bacterium]